VDRESGKIRISSGKCAKLDGGRRPSAKVRAFIDFPIGEFK
jgi:hypothetical protein